jgi:hypothetical protein
MDNSMETRIRSDATLPETILAGLDLLPAADRTNPAAAIQAAIAAAPVSRYEPLNGYRAVNPPSTTRFVPVTHELSSEAR